MTEQKAIEVLENDSCYECTYGTSFGASECKCTDCEVANATRMAIKALEKQIAKKPIEIKGLTFGLTKDGDESYVIICECPNCRSRKLKRGFPCKCGQKLDWE